MQGKLIRDKMLEISMEEFRYKHPILWAWVCKEGVFQLNDDGYNP
jgi:hypothetical protein